MSLKVFIIVTFFVAVTAGQKPKNNDEDNPYEFGFTIDGQQHRHESKDVNGIIQGEFGFITADGIYHTTVYATDENGNFKILSMRSVRVSAPLDGSALPEGQRIGNAPNAKSQGAVAQAASTQAPSTTTRQNLFTLAKSTLASCGSCGYVTTSKPLGPLPFRTPQFQNQPQVSAVNENGPNNDGNSAVNPQNNENGPNNAGQSYNNDGNSPVNPQNNVNIFGNRPDAVNQYQIPPNNDNQRETPGNYGENELNPQTRAKQSPLAQVRVDDGIIRVPGNPDIPIQDKYPGMVDGLPNGVSEKDVTDLLYKFNYTVGFHGHYEKGLKNGAKIGGYFVTGRDGLSRIVTYIADENGFRPKVKFVRLDLSSDEVPKEGTEKTFGLKHFEFVWYPID